MEIGAQLTQLISNPASLANISPQLALAVAEGCQLAPMVLACKVTFSDTTTQQLNVVLENGQGATLSQASLITGITYEIDQPAANSGNFLKGANDYYFNEQSGITATLDVVGTPRFTVCQFAEPLRIVRDMANTRVQSGWVLNGTQSIRMNFFPPTGTPSLITPPTTITFAFLMLQPAGTDRYIYLSSKDAIAQLIALGVDLPAYVKNRKVD
jgi:hypothetical protein